MNTTIESLEQRIATLERTIKTVVVTFGAGLLVLVLSAASRSGPVRAQAFQLLSDEGEVRAELVLQDGQPEFHLKDREGVNRVSLFHQDDASGLYVMDEEGVTRIGVAQFAHGGGGVALHGPDSKGAAVLYLKGAGSLRFFDENGAVTNQVLGDQPGDSVADSPE